MKSNVNSWGLFVCLLVVQLVISNYVNLSPFISLTILPAMMMCTPMSMPTAWVMAVAFLTGISTDLLTAGAVGLNAVSLVPVAAARNFIVTLVCGNEVVERGSDFNFKKYGALKVITVTLLSLALFLAIYIIADAAGTRPFWFNLCRFLCSLLCDLVLCLLTVRILNPNDRR